MLKFNISNMPHVKATLMAEHKIIYKDNQNLIIYNTRADTYIAEGLAGTIKDKIKKLKIERFETTNKEVFDFLLAMGKFKHYQICRQCYHSSSKGTADIDLPSPTEIKWIAKTYGTSVDNITTMRQNNEIFVYRKNGEAVSYIGIQIDGSIGMLYTKPAYRRCGYATQIEEELFKIKKHPIFVQILVDNKISLAMHKKNGWKFNRYKIYWLFNKRF